jgi:hypothetical protein
MYKVEMTHQGCGTCREFADNALLNAKLTNAQEVTTSDEGCLATAVLTTEEDYAEVWK